VVGFLLPCDATGRARVRHEYRVLGLPSNRGQLQTAIRAFDTLCIAASPTGGTLSLNAATVDYHLRQVSRKAVGKFASPTKSST
jgi:hypothetical protein